MADEPGGGARASCPGCDGRFPCRQGIFRFLLAERARQVQPFLEQYRHVRERDGFRSADPEYYRRLPDVTAQHPQANTWRVRQETFRRLARAIRDRGRRQRVLDLGAGNGWLSNRLAEAGHHCVAVDWLDDEQDGLGAHRHYKTSFACVQADFNALPFVPGQFDLVIFNGSLHYAMDPIATLTRARQMLAPEGALLVMDSPTFRSDTDGRAMVRELEDSLRRDYQLDHFVRQGTGYVTLTRLRRAARALDLKDRFVASRNGLLQRARRAVARLRMGRQPAAFGLWVAQ